MRKPLLSLILSALLAPALAAAQEPAAEDTPNIDPFEPINRGIYRFNDVADKYVFRPVAKGYNFILPQPARTGVANFFDNWTYPVTIVNGFLQGKFDQGVRDTTRFVFNSTFGVFGLFDVATAGGLPENHEDFGLTFGHWGVPQGPYVVIPILGPATARSGVGILANVQVNPVVQMENSSVRDKLLILWFIETRAALVGPDETINDAFDPYLFVRDAYLQNRRYLLEGAPAEDSFFDEDFEDF